MVANISPSAPVQVTGITFEQFLKDYAGQHAEWHPDGSVEIVMAGNDSHMMLSKFLTVLLEIFLEAHPIGILITTPYTMRVDVGVPAREPDLMILLEANKDRKKHTYVDGAADIAIELVSPESVERDYVTKFGEYETAGVPEYWLMDVKRETALIYELRTVEGEHLYKRRPLDRHGRLNSGVLSGFALDPAMLWRETPPSAHELLALIGAMSGVTSSIADDPSQAKG